MNNLKIKSIFFPKFRFKKYEFLKKKTLYIFQVDFCTSLFIVPNESIRTCVGHLERNQEMSWTVIYYATAPSRPGRRRME